MKQLSQIRSAPDGHWVGDGFPVRTMFSYNTDGAEVSPFLMLDYAGPTDFPAASQPRGVGEHPHRGFETVTIIYQGEIEHKDTAGNHGSIGPGDVQWMTAAKGVLHEEMHSRTFTENGGTLEMIQLWVNLPAKNKMNEPRYQEILNATIPAVKLGNDGSVARIIAGNFNGTNGPAHSFTPINLWDLRLKAGHRTTLSMPEGFSTTMLILSGQVQINGNKTANATELALFELTGEDIELKAQQDATVLVMGGEPIDEPISGHGPFVMNTRKEIFQAVSDFQAGRF